MGSGADARNNPNDRQVGGDHYKSATQHWDLAIEHKWDYLQGQVIKYMMRWKKKNGLQDLEKAQHFLEKYIEAVRTGKIPDPTKSSPQELYEDNMKRCYGLAPESKAYLASTI